MDSLYVVMPAYNEEANIEETIRSWYGILEGKSETSRLVVADSGSNDRTHEILIKLCNEYSKLEILENTDRQHGPKVIALYAYAIENGANSSVQINASRANGADKGVAAPNSDNNQENSNSNNLNIESESVTSTESGAAQSTADDSSSASVSTASDTPLAGQSESTHYPSDFD